MGGGPKAVAAGEARDVWIGSRDLVRAEDVVAVTARSGVGGVRGGLELRIALPDAVSGPGLDIGDGVGRFESEVEGSMWMSLVATPSVKEALAATTDPVLQMVLQNELEEDAVELNSHTGHLCRERNKRAEKENNTEALPNTSAIPHPLLTLSRSSTAPSPAFSALCLCPWN
ncbi:hypothetical protein SAY86_002379 [Trapa natans]|uniref:Uncharacterized protein n=1 Tax=Trapa natans TaxID=22666 RepID=A0AAN7R2E3_TRANT|nr:hypothetical protein SAY86_002379 [Trapa natans]